MPTNIIDILEKCPLFADVPGESFGRLVAMGTLRRLKKDEWVFREGQECPGVYVVGEGLVRVFKAAASGKEHVLHMVGPGETFAEVAAIGQFPCPAHAQAAQDSLCALLPSDRFRAALEADHAMCLGLMKGMSRWVRHLVGLVEDIALRDAAGRLARYLLDAPSTDDGTVELPMLRRHLASHLNLTSETFSRTLRRLTDAGLIDSPDDQGLRLLQPDALRQVAQGRFPEL
ncbi:MAG: Crp/Fnr family transcriptional regulator [Pirellulales bacterium]|nr:Crp/Fnr family transcriptional regulator [Pirellulales bacterium]